jgi:hypothetical protein
MSLRRPPPVGPAGLIPPPPVHRAPSRSASTLSVAQAQSVPPATKPVDRIPVPVIPPRNSTPPRAVSPSATSTSPLKRAMSAPRLPTEQELSPRKAVSFTAGTARGASDVIPLSVNPAFGPMMSAQPIERSRGPTSPSRENLRPQTLPPAIYEEPALGQLQGQQPPAPNARPVSIARKVLDAFQVQQLERPAPYSAVRRSGFASPTREEFRRVDPLARAQPFFRYDQPEVPRFKYEPPPMLRDTYWESEKYSIRHTPGRFGMTSDADAVELGLSNQYLRPGDRWGSPSRDRTGRSTGRQDSQPSFSRGSSHAAYGGRQQVYDYEDEYLGPQRPSRVRDSREETPVRDVTPRYRTRSPAGRVRDSADEDTIRGHRRAREEIRSAREEERLAAQLREVAPVSQGWKRDYDFTQRSHRSRRHDHDELAHDQPRQYRSKEAENPDNQIPDSYVVGARQKLVVPVRDETPTRRSSRHEGERDLSRSRRREGEDEEEYRARRRAERELRRQRHVGQ